MNVLLCRICLDRIPLRQAKTNCTHGVDGGACVGCGRKFAKLHCMRSHADPAQAFRMMLGDSLIWRDRSPQEKYRDGWERVFGHEALP
jgi:hypothetical protein